MKRVLKKIKSFFKKEFCSFKKLVLDNKLYFVLLLVCIINDILLRCLTLKSIREAFRLTPILGDIILINILFSFSFFMKKKSSRYTYLLILTYITSIICIINSSYFTYYSSYTSVSLLSTTQYLGEVSTALDTIIKPIDFIYLLLPLVITVYLTYNDKKISDEINKVFKNFLVVNRLTLMSIIIFLISLKPVDYSRLVKQWNRIYLVQKFGIYYYHANDLIKSVEPRISGIFGYDKAKKEVDDYFMNKPDNQDYHNEYTNIFKDKNIIAIHGESIQSFVIGMKINGKEVTPNLNRLIREGLYFDNYYAQVSVGTSSDSEFTINTGLLPPKLGVAFVSYADKTYNTIPKYLHDLGYYNMSFHANKGDFWNRNIMYKSLAYDKFYDKKDYELDNLIGLGLSDKSFFSQTASLLEKEMKDHKKIYSTVIMLTNHTPFSKEVIDYTTDPLDITMHVGYETYPYLDGSLMGRYLNSVHYADEAIGKFMSELDNKGILENSVIMFYGDHDARLPMEEYQRLYNYDYKTGLTYSKEHPNYKEFNSYEYKLNKKVPFFLWSKNDNHKINKTVHNTMGAYNIFPTIGNMFGFYNKYTMGKDIFNTGDDNYVVFPDGSFISNEILYDVHSNRCYDIKNKKLIKKEMEPVEYITRINKEKTDMFNISNDIIVYNLLKDNNEKE